MRYQWWCPSLVLIGTWTTQSVANLRSFRGKTSNLSFAFAFRIIHGQSHDRRAPTARLCRRVSIINDAAGP
jgi:hypothetical protein